MKVSKLIDAWGVLFLIAVVSFLFWFHIQEAPSVASRAPNFVIIFIVFLWLLVARRVFIKQREEHLLQLEETSNDDANQVDLNNRNKASIFGFFRRQSVPLFFMLGFIYFFTFNILGFSISNFIFIFTSMALVKNYQSDFSLNDLPTVFLTGLITSGLLYFFAKLTSFNIPSGIFGI
jgi:hypothetical protein